MVLQFCLKSPQRTVIFYLTLPPLGCANCNGNLKLVGVNLFLYLFSSSKHPRPTVICEVGSKLLLPWILDFHISGIANDVKSLVNAFFFCSSSDHRSQRSWRWSSCLQNSLVSPPFHYVPHFFQHKGATLLSIAALLGILGLNGLISLFMTILQFLIEKVLKSKPTWYWARD